VNTLVEVRLVDAKSNAASRMQVARYFATEPKPGEQSVMGSSLSTWPRDGKRETLEGAGIALAEQYRDQGLYMLRDHAQFEDGSVSVEAGLMMMLDRIRTGKLKVFKEHLDWWEGRPAARSRRSSRGLVCTYR
jgi:hypothetical protein